MAHREQLQYIDRIQSIFPSHFTGRRVLEIGSLDINGTIRSRFTGCDYVGIDVDAGPGVDRVCEGQEFDAPDGSFDTVISCEVMEHNPYWKETFRNMVRLCAPGGLVVMTCAALGRKEHGTSRSNAESSPLTVSKGWDYYRNLTARDFVATGALSPLAESWFFENWAAYDLYFAGVKERLDPGTRARVEGLARQYRRENLGSLRAVRRYLKANLLLRR